MRREHATREAKKGHPTTQRVAMLIGALRGALVKEYGSDFAFMIAAQGNVIGASNSRDGHVLAVGGGGRNPSVYV